MASGIVFVRSWSATPAGATDAPQAKSVELIPGTTCADPYYSAWDTLPDGTTRDVECHYIDVRAPLAVAQCRAWATAALEFGTGASGAVLGES